MIGAAVERALREVVDVQHKQTQRHNAELKKTLKTLKQDSEAVQARIQSLYDTITHAQDNVQFQAGIQALYGNT